MGVSRKQSTPNFPKNKHFLPPVTHIFSYSHWHATMEKRRGLPCPSWKSKKSVLILERKALILSITGLNFPFKMQFWEYLRRKNSKMFHWGTPFSCVFDKMFIEVPEVVPQPNTYSEPSQRFQTELCKNS